MIVHFLCVLLALLGAVLVVQGVIPFYPGLSGHVPSYAYPLGIFFSLFGVAAISLATLAWVQA